MSHRPAIASTALRMWSAGPRAVPPVVITTSGGSFVERSLGGFQRVCDVDEGHQLSADRLDPPGKLRRKRITHLTIARQPSVGELITENQHSHSWERNHVDQVVSGRSREAERRRREQLPAEQDALPGAHLFAAATDVITAGRPLRSGPHDAIGLDTSLAPKDIGVRRGNSPGADPNTLATAQRPRSITSASVTNDGPGTSASYRPAIHR